MTLFGNQLMHCGEAFELPAVEDFEFTVRFPGQHEAERKVELQSEQKL